GQSCSWRRPTLSSTLCRNLIDEYRSVLGSPEPGVQFDVVVQSRRGFMQTVLLKAPGWTAVILSSVIAVGCGSGTMFPPDAGTINGTYALQWFPGPIMCTPAALPNAVGSDPSKYLSPPAADSPRPPSLSVRINGDSVSLTLLDASGAAAALGSYEAVAGKAGTALQTAGMMEGPRGSGEIFYATDSARLDYSILQLVLLPPGIGAQDDISMTSSSTFTFRVAGPTSPIFTTCVVRDSAAGSRPNYVRGQ
ncbi:MAG: hypothetical protein ABI442_09060, partial [Gemmatimonadaceae bacterium]